jgi:hypothetical protein
MAAGASTSEGEGGDPMINWRDFVLGGNTVAIVVLLIKVF